MSMSAAIGLDLFDKSATFVVVEPAEGVRPRSGDPNRY
jgi:hypothetical protein